VAAGKWESSGEKKQTGHHPKDAVRHHRLDCLGRIGPGGLWPGSVPLVRQIGLGVGLDTLGHAGCLSGRPSLLLILINLELLVERDRGIRGTAVKTWDRWIVILATSIMLVSWIVAGLDMRLQSRADLALAVSYDYKISILQAEFSLTQVPDRPLTGRSFYEATFRENLDLGRPEQAQLISDRQITRRTPARFRTRIITEGGHSSPARGLQTFSHQAVPQGRPCFAHRNDDP
jgi:hypothetical protein